MLRQPQPRQAEERVAAARAAVDQAEADSIGWVYYVAEKQAAKASCA
mgnify:CR=1 FL=1